MDTQTHTTNPMLADMSAEALLAEIAARGLKVAVKPEKPAKPAKVKLTDAEVLAKIVVIATLPAPVAVQEGEEAPAPVEVDPDLAELRTVLVAKWRTTTAKQEATKRPAPTGKKRGRKSEAEKQAEAAGSAPSETPSDAPTETPASEG